MAAVDVMFYSVIVLHRVCAESVGVCDGCEPPEVFPIKQSIKCLINNDSAGGQRVREKSLSKKGEKPRGTIRHLPTSS